MKIDADVDLDYPPSLHRIGNSANLVFYAETEKRSGRISIEVCADFLKREKDSFGKIRVFAKPITWTIDVYCQGYGHVSTFEYGPDGRKGELPDELVTTLVREHWHDVIRSSYCDYIEGGRPCEVCAKSMNDHEWADLDSNGFVFNCSFNESTNKNQQKG